MTSLGIHWPLLLAQLANLALIVAWVALCVIALRLVWRSDLPPAARMIWAALIILLPLVGALAYLIARARFGWRIIRLCPNGDKNAHPRGYCAATP